MVLRFVDFGEIGWFVDVWPKIKAEQIDENPKNTEIEAFVWFVESWKTCKIIEFAEFA